jgi:hypothetical protein
VRKNNWLPTAYALQDEANNWVKCDDGTFFNLYTPPSRAEQKKRLKTEEFDLLVIGGVSDSPVQ